MNKFASNGEIGEPYEQCRVMCSAGRSDLVGTVSVREHFA
jgi:hypothetical protein